MTRERRSRRRLCALTLLAALSLPSVTACHEYRTVPASALQPPAAVRVQSEPARQLAADAGREMASAEFTGRITARRGDSIDVRIDAATPTADRRAATGLVLTLPADPATVQVRQFLAGRTALAGLGVLGIAAFGLFLACGEFCR